jgi:hypothetical protein
VIKRLMLGIALMSLALFTTAGCGGDTGSETDAGTPASESTQPSATSAAAVSKLVGSWHRPQACEEVLAAFEEAGLVESHRDWLQGNFYGGQPGPKKGDPCAGAQGPLEHDHYFTGDGGFGSHDQNGEQVDDGDFEEIDADTVTFPSHAEEFGYEGDISVDYAVDGDLVKFEVNMPNPCADACADAYAWALSAFASGPWQRGEVPAQP